MSAGFVNQKDTVFISWSGKRSKELARLFVLYGKDLLTNVSFYFSSDEIKGGEKQRQNIESCLNNTNFGIVFLTSTNLSSKWIYFEAGAISRTLEKHRIIPLLYDIDIEKIGEPFSAYQGFKIDKESLLKVFIDINDFQENWNKIPEQTIKNNFNRLWKDFDFDLKKVNEINEDEVHPEIRDASLLSQDDMLREILLSVRDKEYSDPTLELDSSELVDQEYILNYLISDHKFNNVMKKEKLAIFLKQNIVDNKKKLSNKQLSSLSSQHGIKLKNLKELIILMCTHKTGQMWKVNGKLDTELREFNNYIFRSLLETCNQELNASSLYCSRYQCI